MTLQTSKAVAIFTESFDFINQKVERTLAINDIEVANETLNPKINSKMKVISGLMIELEQGHEFKEITQSEFNIILDVYKSSTPEYFEGWLKSKIK